MKRNTKMISTTALNSININRVLRTLWELEPIPRINISKQLDLDKSTITKIMTQLLERGIVVEKTIGDAGPVGGRKPVNLGINPQYGAMIGVELQTDLARIIGVTITGQILFQEQQVLNFDKTNISDLFEQIIIQYKKKLELQNWRVIGASLGIAGIINPYHHTILRSNPLSITEPIALDHSMEERLGIPIFLENDTRCCCWADLVHNRGSHANHFMYILGEFRKHNVSNIDTRVLAVGFAFVIDGKVHYGHNFTSGEFSSVLKKDHNVSQFSTPNRQTSSQGISDPNQREKVFIELAKNAAFLTNMLNLKTIGFAGDVVEYQDELTTVIKKAIQANWSYRNQAEIDIVFTPFREWAVAYGAAALIIEQLFALPKVNEDQDQSLPMGIGLFDLIDSLRE